MHLFVIYLLFIIYFPQCRKSFHPLNWETAEYMELASDFKWNTSACKSIIRLMTLQQNHRLDGSLECQISSRKCVYFYPSFFFPLAQLCIFTLISKKERELCRLYGKCIFLRCFLWLKSSQMHRFGLYWKVEQFRSFLSQASFISGKLRVYFKHGFLWHFRVSWIDGTLHNHLHMWIILCLTVSVWNRRFKKHINRLLGHL